MSAAPARRNTRAPVAGSRSAGNPGRRNGEPKKAKLRVVDKAALRRRARQRTLVSLAAGLVTLSLFGVALLYGQLVEGQKELDTMRAEIAQAQAERARLEREVAVASTPDAIVQRAFELGMVRSVDPQYLTAVRSIEDDR
jgi:cell division protein FtsB